MGKDRVLMTFILILLGSLMMPWGYAQEGQKIHYNAFSHNDYWRERPLLDALEYRFNCVEADLWLIDGELYVSHDRPEPNPEITFKRLYIDPLARLLKENGGKIYPSSDRPFYLMVDCKTNGEEMYPVLKRQMAQMKDHLCSVENGKYRENAILFFISGDRPKKSIMSEKNRFTFLDGRVEDLDKGIPASVMPVVSDNYSLHIKWNGDGEIPTQELEKMRSIIEKAHKEGKLFRWWGAPDSEQFKLFFANEGVDLIGADNLKILFDLLENP